MKNLWEVTLGIGIMVFLLMILLTLIDIKEAVSAEPQSAVIEFTSAEDLIARTDSVMAVCDTMQETVYTGYPSKLGANVLVIRHRRLVGVTVTEETVYKASFNNKAQWVRHPDFVIYPGTAVVWFEWEVR